ncbi:hypothetical protein HS088_TW23G00425 [Tripterygium wilfordii]|uniref:Hydroxyproline-rich glycoprotein family protein n=1 Tax=Tripterygium wilfordii TaxID=458696 RepID=A0A7J7BV42_TRIWF|nr:ricin B-like lectin R40G3 [Tripterygium wilfordii]KAF5725698.1 hypothetical protein HS088_TW23G00425 [Tripterygium wilfordii]
MEPFGHHSHTHHHHRRNDDDENEPRNYYPPPPAPYQQSPDFEPPRHVGHVHHDSFGYGGPPPPPTTHVAHVSHESYGYEAPPPPRHVAHVNHDSYGYEAPPPPTAVYGGAPSDPFYNASPDFGRVPPRTEAHHSDGPLAELSGKPTFKVYCKSDPNYFLTIRDGKVILALSDPSDEYQHWYKDEKYSTRVKDEEGSPAFALVNKATGQAVKHSIGESHPVQLIPYNPKVLDESILWTESKDFGEGYRAVRMVNNVHLNVDAFHGDKYSGGVHNGTTIVLWKWKKGENQLWKITRY